MARADKELRVDLEAHGLRITDCPESGGFIVRHNVNSERLRPFRDSCRMMGTGPHHTHVVPKLGPAPGEGR